MQSQIKPMIHIDIISDVVCPWCIVGFKRLSLALAEMKDQLDYQIFWHPFELNPQMVEAGENLREHLMGKYNISVDESRAARANLTQFGLDLGFQFNFHDEMRIYNTFKAHQLLHWALEKGKQTDLKLAFFDAYFTQKKDISKAETLLDIVASLDLDRSEAARILDENRYAEAVRENQQRWRALGIQGVPAVVLENKYLISGAQEPAYFKQALTQLLDEMKAA